MTYEESFRQALNVMGVQLFSSCGAFQFKKLSLSIINSDFI